MVERTSSVIMKLFVFATDREVKPILDSLRIKPIKKFVYTRTYFLCLNGNEFCVCLGGIGKVSSAASIAGLVHIKTKPIDEIINVGVAGSINPDKAGILDAVISTSLVQHDVDTTPVGDPAGLISGINKVYFDADENIRKKLVKAASKAGVKPVEGIVASGEQFIATDEQRKRISETFGAITVDMEAAAEAQVAYMLGIPFCSLKVISDANDHAKEYRENEKKAAELAAKIILEYLQMD